MSKSKSPSSSDIVSNELFSSEELDELHAAVAGPNFAATNTLPQEDAGGAEWGSPEKSTAKAEPTVEKKPGFVEKLSETNPYVAMLGVAFVAIVLACFVLVLELSSYGFTTKKQSIRNFKAASLHVEPAHTIAVV